MFSPAKNDCRICVANKSRGFALLIMLAIILVAFTTIAISRLSQNSGEQKSRAKTTQVLVQSRDAIITFALSAAIPGTLPCPDGDGIPPVGEADVAVAGICPNLRGLVPFVTLGIPQPLDGTGTSIWYVVSAQYSGTPATPHNSTRASLLRLNTTLEMAFILLAPNDPLPAQVRTSRTPPATDVAQFLEADNADLTTPNSYTDFRDDSHYDSMADTQNDQVMGMSVGSFWTNVEGRVLREVGALLRDYRTNCNAYPWPALYASFGTNNSDTAPLVTRVYEGRIPLGTASPAVWGAPCAPTLPAGWIFTHWGDSLYYAICRQAVPVNPPTTSCLQLGVPVGAEAILIAPGIAILAQDRLTTPVVISDYFENQNSSTLDNMFTQLKPSNYTNTFNDLVYVIR